MGYILLFTLILGKSYTGSLRNCEYRRRHNVETYGVLYSQHVVYCPTSLILSSMSKHTTSVDVADSINTRNGGLHILVNDDASWRMFYRRILQAEARDTRSTSCSHKYEVGRNLLLLSFAREKDDVVGNLLYTTLHVELYASFLESLTQTLRYVAIENGKTLRKIFHNGYLVAESAVYARHLHTYYASTDYHKTAGNGVRCESLCGGGSKEFFGRNDIGFTGSLNR